jgi:hypothetical protein
LQVETTIGFPRHSTWLGLRIWSVLCWQLDDPARCPPSGLGRGCTLAGTGGAGRATSTCCPLTTQGGRDRTATDMSTPQKIHQTIKIPKRRTRPHAPRVATVPSRLRATHPPLASHRPSRNYRSSPSTKAMPPTCGTVLQVPLGRDAGGSWRQRERPTARASSSSFLARHGTTPSGQVHSPARARER